MLCRVSLVSATIRSSVSSPSLEASLVRAESTWSLLTAASTSAAAANSHQANEATPWYGPYFVNIEPVEPCGVMLTIERLPRLLMVGRTSEDALRRAREGP